ncbi:hypothetical protein IGI04_042588 [Brassica rapa subsp. trilocularis]|uniref:DUF287 domain-containing protein n=1 Tax=Brassica rapa subsp. trilocularis TaxID=1813537 RepID=A0ABQ7KKX5_BRACM|nr:hypothetical protein IGI04_042588 [Brassica rapa subsp. trilocularis]
MDMKHRSGRSEKLEEENEWVVSRVVKTALKSCGIWSNHIKVEPLKVRAAEESQTASLEKIHVKVEPLKEVAAEEGQTARLKVHEAKGVILEWKHGNSELYQLVGRLKCLWSELDGLRPSTSDPKVIQDRQEQGVVFNLLVDGICKLVQHMCEKNKRSTQWKGGTSCKRRRLRKLSKVWFMMRRPWREESESDDLRHMMGLKGIKDVVHQMVRGECSYSAYMGETVENRGVLTEQEKGDGADDHITRKEWRRGNGTESGEQEQNQEDSGLHDQDTSQEVENNVQSSGEVDEVQSSGEEQVRPVSSEEEQVEPASVQTEDYEIKRSLE